MVNVLPGEGFAPGVGAAEWKSFWDITEPLPLERRPAVGSCLPPSGHKGVEGALLHSGLCPSILEDLPGSCCCLGCSSTKGHLSCSLTTL